jgi:hypothetical protein
MTSGVRSIGQSISALFGIAAFLRYPCKLRRVREAYKAEGPAMYRTA